jgi:hypothetical protein
MGAIEEIWAKSARQTQLLAEKKLKVWTGPGFRNRTTRIEYEHVYVCAKSFDKAVQLVCDAGNDMQSKNHAKNYWAKGCWGNAMCDVVPEVGVWAQLKSGEVVRLI